MGSDEDGQEPASKRRRTTGRRKAACQSCGLRKVRCDNARPKCLSCQTTGSECVYLNEPDESLTLNRAVEILGNQINYLAEKLDSLTAANVPSSNGNGTHIVGNGNGPANATNDNVNLLFHDVATFEQPLEPSRDFSHIPPHKTTADEVLTWPIFENAFPSNYLIDAHLGYRLSSGGIFDDDVNADSTILQISSNVVPLDEHRIPALVDRFLENVHTKNPILDVETLVRKSREHASRGLGWDSYSCLLLMACALGLIAKPFGSELEALNYDIPIDRARHISAPAREKEQADNCFVQASRRLGGLRPSILAAQCNFFAGVYLMYTLRPMLSWQYFHQASITYQLYLKMNGRISEDGSVLMNRPLQTPSTSSRTTRLEQRLYWSCFKSEAEFRIELPLPQTEIAAYAFPNLFPSPPSPLATDNQSALNHSASPPNAQVSSSNISISQMLSPGEDDEVKMHAKRLCNEEESWYYYLTEVALRRIGNRVVNTFFRQDRSEWMNIEPLLDVAIEFEAQVSTWQTNLPSAMQKYEINSTIRAPRIASPGGAEAGFVVRELSWATENRLLEMRHWLYQPFLYYLVHARPELPLAMRLRQNSIPQAVDSPSNMQNGEQNTFWTLILRAIDCNLKILDTRTIPHRHHGLWYDLRAIICSSFILLAVVKSGYIELIPGGRQTLVGDAAAPSKSPGAGSASGLDQNAAGDTRRVLQGKFGRVLRQLEIWSLESPDMIRAREVLEMLIWQVVHLG